MYKVSLGNTSPHVNHLMTDDITDFHDPLVRMILSVPRIVGYSVVVYNNIVFVFTVGYVHLHCDGV